MPTIYDNNNINNSNSYDFINNHLHIYIIEQSIIILYTCKICFKLTYSCIIIL
jgi:hypothetical protein